MPPRWLRRLLLAPLVLLLAVAVTTTPAAVDAAVDWTVLNRAIPVRATFARTGG